MRIFLRTGGAILALIAAAPMAAAQEEATDTFLPALVLVGEKNDGLWVYGQIDKGFLVYDDGEATDVYPLVDNANSSTRFGVWYRNQWTEDVDFGANFEFEWTPYSTSYLSRLNDDINLDRSTVRKAEVKFATTIGTLWVGQGSMASDGTSEVDYSGTGVIAYASIGDTAGGQRFAFDTGGISGVSVGGAFKDYDGLSRKMRARYDTGKLLGESVELRASIGYDALSGDEDSMYDVAAVYTLKDDETFGFGAAVAYSRPDDDTNQINGSVSGIHKPTGLNLTLAAGGQDTTGADPSFLYAKLGWLSHDLTGLGDTAFAVDWYGGQDVAASGSDSMSVGLAAVQTLDYYQTDLYTTVRWYSYDDSAANYEDGVAFLTGFRIRF